MKNSILFKSMLSILGLLLVCTLFGQNNGDVPPPPPPPPPMNDVGEVFKVVEQMPRFPGCENMKAPEKEIKECASQKMLEFVYTTLKYPKAAKINKIEGMAVVQFVINESGKVSDPRVVRDIDGHFEKAVLQMMNKMPNWIPGMQRGKAVKVQYTLPVKFKLKDDPVKPTKGNLDRGQGKPNSNVGKNSGHAKVGPMSKPKTTKINPKQKADPNSEVPPPPPPAPNTDKGETFKVVEKMPRFPGCENSNFTDAKNKQCADGKLLQYIYKNLKYPEDARKNGVEGTAVVRFVVMEDGSLGDFEIIRDPGAGLGMAAKEVLESMNSMDERWTPGMQRGRAVKVLYTMPIKFKLENSNKTKKRKKGFLKRGNN